MEVDVDANVRGSLHGFQMGLMVLTAVWSVSALAASELACDNSGHRLQTLNVSVEALGADTVDHIGATAETAAAPKPADTVNHAIAPLLYLTPHIAAILNSVFDSTEANPGQQPATRELTVPEASRPATTASAPQATAADVEDATAPANSTNGANSAFRNDDIARFQRQMYRKDI
jgi:hypothetical protein